MDEIDIEKSPKNTSITSIDMTEVFSYDAYIQFMEDSNDYLIDGATNY